MACSADDRRAGCVHVAAHATVAALGGVTVHELAVAELGATRWRYDCPLGHWTVERWAGCTVADDLAHVWLAFAQWSPPDRAYRVNVEGYGRMMRPMPAHQRASTWHRLRAHLCLLLAGPMAEHWHTAGAWPWRSDDERQWPDGDDAKARALARLLPGLEGYQRCAQATRRALEEVQTWDGVQALADALEAVGRLDGEHLTRLLPPHRPGWPPPG